MRRRLFTSIVLVLMLVLATSVCLAGCKPGYKEVWEPIAPYNYEWDKTNGDIDTIIERVNEDCIEVKNKERAQLEKENAERRKRGEQEKPNYTDPTYLLSQMRLDGSFKSIEYDLDTKAFWPPLDHLRNVLFLQVARNDKNNEQYYQSEEIKKAVSSAMQYWVEKDYHCDWNWWYNEVGVGMYLPNIILFGVDGLAEESKAKMLGKIEGTLLHKKPLRFKLYERKCNEGGGNLADQALSTLKFCLATGDGNTIMWVTKQIENELRPFPPYKGPKYHRWDAEGPKEDYSFQQHDQLLYFGGYGEVMMDGFNKYMNFTKNTQFEISSEAANFYAELVLNGFQFATRNGYRDISASGRGAIRRNGLKGIYGNIKTTIDVLLDYNATSKKCKLDAKNVAALEQLKADRYGDIDKGAGGHRYYYESDYNVINNERYMASVRHASDRTRVFEYLNGENPLGYYTGLGATFYYVDGDEYYNILPMYNWNKIPGTTTRQGKIVKMNQDFSYSTYGNNKYAMGVSNGKVGMSYFRQDDHAVNARKAYFMFEDGVVVLGSDIRCGLPGDIVTNINQTRLDGDVVVGQSGKENVLNTNTNLNGVFDYVYHDKIGYISNGDLTLGIEKGKKGDWKTINERNRESLVTEADIFTLDLNHGKWPMGKSAEYTVLMNTTPELTKAYAANPTLKVIANTKAVQAVYDTRNHVLEAVFHKGGTIDTPIGTVKVSAGACLMVEKIGSKLVMNIVSNDYREHNVNISVGDMSTSVTIAKRPLVITF